jgi:hypothetical protein
MCFGVADQKWSAILLLPFVWPCGKVMLYSAIIKNTNNMIKNIQQFPLLDTLQYILRSQAFISLCRNEIIEMENQVECLRMELDSTPLEYEQDQIAKDIVDCYLYIEVCETNKDKIYSRLKQFNFILN